MPIHEFKCIDCGAISEKLFLTFADAENVGLIPCPVCRDAVAVRIISLPGAPILYGEGFYKPAASGNHSYKRNDPSKAAKDMAKEMGAGNIAKAMKSK